jgi:hypothetical protein
LIKSQKRRTKWSIRAAGTIMATKQIQASDLLGMNDLVY